MRAYVSAQESRKAAEAVAKPFEAEEKRLKEKILAALKASGKSSAKRGEFRALLESVPGRVSWKDEFLAVAGAEGVAEAESRKGTTERLTVVPA